MSNTVIYFRQVSLSTMACRHMLRFLSCLALGGAFAGSASADELRFTRSAHIVVLGAHSTVDGVRLRLRARSGGGGELETTSTPVGNAISMLTAFRTRRVGSLPLVVDGPRGPRMVSTGEDGRLDIVLPVQEARFAVLRTAEATTWFDTVHVTPTKLSARTPVVISDFDDTIAQTHVSDKPRMIFEMLTRSAEQVAVVPGAPEAYGHASDAGAALLIVSGSPEELAPRIRTVLKRNRLPDAPLFLKNLDDSSLFEHQEHKLNTINALIAEAPASCFVLVGDAGERDPSIYRRVKQEHADRIGSIIIRRPPGTKVDPDGLVVVDDYSQDPHVIARAVKAGCER